MSLPARSSLGAEPEAARRGIREQLEAAVLASKCHGCGCLHQTVEALESTPEGRGPLAPALAEARRVFAPKEYDCLGCSVCYPAIAANAFADAFPAQAERLDLCPTDAPRQRRGWPPLPGDYHVVRHRAPVAVCTLNSSALAARLAAHSHEGLAISGTLHTENLGGRRPRSGPVSPAERQQSPRGRGRAAAAFAPRRRLALARPIPGGGARGDPRGPRLRRVRVFDDPDSLVSGGGWRPRKKR